MNIGLSNTPNDSEVRDTDRIINILYIADIVGDPGFRALRSCLKTVKNEHNITLTLANGENRVGGRGLTLSTAREMLELGVDIITSGNHIWNRKEIKQVFEQEERVLRPHNYPPGCPGHGLYQWILLNQVPVAVLNLQGRSFMYSIDCPFRCADTVLEEVRSRGTHVIIIDFHAEATAEKVALGWYLDGKASAVIGSHTHVQTADERILPEGTAYITDAGMTGSFASVIGMDKDVAIQRFITQIPIYYKLAETDLKVCGVIVGVNVNSGRAVSIERFQKSIH